MSFTDSIQSAATGRLPEEAHKSRKSADKGKRGWEANGCRGTIGLFHRRHFDMSQREKDVDNEITLVMAEFHCYLLQIQDPDLVHAGLCCVAD